MKITDIKRDHDMYTVTIEPNFIQKIFGKLPRVETYKEINRNYAHSDASVYVNNKGEIIGWFNPITKKLDNWKQSF